MIRFWSICRNTFMQTIRQPIFGIVIMVTIAVLVMQVPLSAWTMGGGTGEYRKSDQKMLENLGLSTLLLSGLFVAAFSASGVLSREIEDRTALTVISKPVARGTFVLGKFAGVAGGVFVAFYLCTLVYLMTVRHQVMSTASDPYDAPVLVLGISAVALTLMIAAGGNYLFGWPFISAAVIAALVLLSVAMGLISFIGKEWRIVPIGYDWDYDRTVLVFRAQLFVGIGLIFMAVFTLVAVAVAAGTRFGQITTLLICVAFLFIGSAHPAIFAANTDAIPAARVFGWALPDLTIFYPLDALASDTEIPGSYVLSAAIYCASYSAALVLIGMAMFQTRQLESQNTAATMGGAVGLLAWSGRVSAFVLGCAAVLVLSQPVYYTLTGLVLACALAVGAVAAWLVWGFFGRGARWSYWVILAIALLVALHGALSTAGVSLEGWVSTTGATGRTTVQFVAAAIVLLILVLPKTRRHFRSA